MTSSFLISQCGQEEQRPLPDQVAGAAVRPGHLGGRGHGRAGVRHLQDAVLEPQVRRQADVDTSSEQPGAARFSDRVCVFLQRADDGRGGTTSQEDQDERKSEAAGQTSREPRYRRESRRHSHTVI